MKTWLYLKQCGMFNQSSYTTSCQNTILGSYDLWFPHQWIPYGTWSHVVWKIRTDVSDNLSWRQSSRFLCNTDTSTTQHSITSKRQVFIYLACNYKSFTWLHKNTWHHSILLRSNYENITHFQWTKDASVFGYTGCFTTLGHNCRRWFPRSLWSKKFI